MDPALIEELKEKLVREQVKLVEDLAMIAARDPAQRGKWQVAHPQLEEDETGTPHASMDEEADESEELEIREQTEAVLAERLDAVEHALDLMKHERYGVCEKCGRPIALDRLRANPAATTDIEHS